MKIKELYEFQQLLLENLHQSLVQLLNQKNKL